MKFIAGFWRLLVGIKDALILLLLLLFFAGLSAALRSSPGGKIGEGALLLDLDGTIVEQPSPRDPVAILSGQQVAREHRLSDILRALDVAQRDNRVKAIVLDLDGFLGAGQVALESVGGALDRVKNSGKPVFAYATGYSDDSYVLAAHASEVWLNPLGGIAFSGPGGSRLYYKGLLDRLGVNAHVYRVGSFKSAVEPFIRTDQSPEARQANEQLANALWSGWQQEIRQARPKARIADAVANPAGQGDLGRAALGYGLVDKLANREEFEARVAQVAGEDKKKRSFRAINLDNWVAANPLRSGGAAIGVVTVAGDIVDGEAGPGTAASETIVRAIRDGMSKHELKALVVRIDSPGGSALASERIRVALLEAKQRGLPVVVSMGSVAASGGYWIATAGDRIFAEPTTITGSIGVFGVLPTFEGSLAKIGITSDGVRTTPLSGQPDLIGGTSPEFDRLAQAGIENIYSRFLTLVSQSRRIPVARVNEIAQGRVWDGGTARQLGLVDQFGSFNEALAEAARRAKLDADEASLVFLERQPSWFEKLVTDWGRPSDEGEEDQAGARDVLAMLGARQQALVWTAVDDARRLAGGASIQARCLECAAALPPRAPALGSLTDWLLSKVKG